jgi:hypothetical protein
MYEGKEAPKRTPYCSDELEAPSWGRSGKYAQYEETPSPA